MGMRRSARKYAERLMRRLASKEPVFIPTLVGSLLEGRAALVTGGTSGIGLSIAEAFARNGADVVVAGRDGERASQAASGINDSTHATAFGVSLDVRDPDAITCAVDEASTLLGRVPDVLVNSAGVNGGGRFGEIDAESFDRVIETNLRGTVLVSQEVARRMVRGRLKGNILNIASSSSLRPANTPYIMSKWGIRGLTLGMAKSLVVYGIVVNGIAPGPTATPMLLPDGGPDISRTSSPIGRYATPEEIANMAVFLVSGAGRTVVGDIVYMTGGSGLLTLDDSGSCEFVL